MFFYITISLLMIISSFLEVFVCRKKLLPLFYVISFILFSVSFLRWNTGSDWDSYLLIYDYISSYEDTMEIGFVFINKIAKNLFDSYTIALFLQGAILFIFQTITIKKFAPLPITTLMIMWGTDFCGIFFVRQSIAISILLFSLLAIQSKRLPLFIILVFFASLIHRSSWIFLPAYWIYNYRFSKKQIILMLAFSFFIYTLSELSSYFSQIGTMLGGMYEMKIEGYISKGSDYSANVGQSASELFLRSMLGRIFLLAMFYTLISRKYKTMYSGLLNLFLFGVLLIPVFFSVSPAFVRLSTSYMSVQDILLSVIMVSIKSNRGRFVYFLLLIIIMCFRLYLKLFVDYGGMVYLPFDTIL